MRFDTEFDRSIFHRSKSRPAVRKTANPT